MPRSMTGYGSGEAFEGEHRITVELKAVNNRYQDFHVRLPRRLNAYESEIRAYLKRMIWRGKVDVFVNETMDAGDAVALNVNNALAGTYVEKARALADELHLPDNLSATDLFRFPEVFSLDEAKQDEGETKDLLFLALAEACTRFTEAAETEGNLLRDDLLKKLTTLSEAVQTVMDHEPDIIESYRARMKEKLEEVLADSAVDNAQMLQAAVMYADKVSTDEETIRLSSHIEQMRETLSEESESIGKHLDFLTQEMNREANTILSKAGDLITADIGITMKTTIEKIREQIQNIA